MMTTATGKTERFFAEPEMELIFLAPGDVLTASVVPPTDDDGGGWGKVFPIG